MHICQFMHPKHRYLSTAPPKPLLLASSLKEHFARFFGKKYVLYNPSTTLTSVSESPCMCLKIKKRFTKDVYPYYIQKSGVSI